MPKGTLTAPRVLNCANCGVEFIATAPRQINCTAACKRERQYKLRVAKVLEGGPRRCPRCGQTKDPDEFTTLGLRCKVCQRDYIREHRDANPEYRRSLTIQRHGLTVDLYDAMFAKQGRACAICRGPEPGGHGVWHIDHDHACCPGQYGCTMCVRGLLCHYCNLMIGMAKERPEVLRAAIAYLT